MVKHGMMGFGLLAMTASCVGTSTVVDAPSGGDGTGAARLSIAIPPVIRWRSGTTDGPSAALLAKAPAPSIGDALITTPAAAFVENAAAPDAQRALDCLTQAVYYEARSEPLSGQQAVAQVVLNRVHNPAHPNSVCGTVYEGSRRSTGCQFSFTCDGSLARRREPTAWARAAAVAGAALSGFVYAPVGTATYYHTTAINPWWAAKVTQVATIGAHIFYRLPGSWGAIGAFRQRYAGVEPSITAGRHIAPLPVEAIIERLVAGVTIHRGTATAEAGDLVAPGSDTGTAPVTTTVAGVRIHRGGAATGAVAGAEATGVTIHRNAGAGVTTATR